MAQAPSLAIVLQGSSPKVTLPTPATERRLADRFGPAVFVASDDTLIVTLQNFPTDTPRSLRAAGREAATLLARCVGGEPCWVAMSGRATGWDPVDAALTALEIGHALWESPRVVLFGDIFVLEVLRRAGSLPVLASILDPLEEYDIAHGRGLAATLAAFVETDLVVSRCARRLGLDRHTVARNLTLAESLLGHSLRCTADRTRIELAFAARKLLRPG